MSQIGNLISKLFSNYYTTFIIISRVQQNFVNTLLIWQAIYHKPAISITWIDKKCYQGYLANAEAHGFIKMEVCVSCQGDFIEGIAYTSVACGICKRWTHRACLNLQDKEFNDLKNLYFYCQICVCADSGDYSVKALERWVYMGKCDWQLLV
mgnify:FL=1